MKTLAILVPVLRRPQNVVPLCEAFGANTGPSNNIYFIADRHDRNELGAIEKAQIDFGNVHVIKPGGGYAAKIHRGVEATGEPLLFFGADDLEPHPGWFEAAHRHLVGDVQVVGTQDLCNPRVMKGVHATHFLVTREYAEKPCIDGRPGPLCQLYDHSFVDDEFVATARKRGVYAFAPEAVVKHNHPMNESAPDDAIYKKGRRRFAMDRRTFRQRSRLWT